MDGSFLNECLHQVLDKSSNSADISSTSCDYFATPKRKLSLCSTPSSPVIFSTSSFHHETPDNAGTRFRSVDVNTEDSPYLQYRYAQCFRNDSNSQETNERSPTKLTKDGRSKWQSAHKSLTKSAFPRNKLHKVEMNRLVADSPLTRRLAAVADRETETETAVVLPFSNHQEIPDCSPLLPSLVEKSPQDGFCSGANLHFDRELLHLTAFPISSEATVVKKDRNYDELTSSSFHSWSEFALSSTPLRCHSTADYTPLRLDGSTNCTVSPVGLQFTPEMPRSRKVAVTHEDSEERQNWSMLERAKRNLFHVISTHDSSSAVVTATDFNSQPRNFDLESPNTGDSPSSGFTSMTSSYSNPNSSVCSESVKPSSENFKNLEFVNSENDASNWLDGDADDNGVALDDDELLDAENVATDNFSNDDSDDLHLPLFWDREQSFIGDFSRPHALPLVRSKHPDLKGISPVTMANVIDGQYDDTIGNFLIVDCRYPYEFNGGHIAGAKNIYCHEELLKKFFTDEQILSPERSVIIFHCEFSSERAPNLIRFLRNRDREVNQSRYPILFYPEIYVLEGGYKAFFEQYSELCEPPRYVPMVDSNHEGDMKRFRAKTRTFKDEHGKRVLQKCFTLLLKNQ